MACAADDDGDVGSEPAGSEVVASGPPATSTTVAPTTTAAPDPITVALVAPSSRDDLSFTQSMVDSLGRLGDEIPVELLISDELADVGAATIALDEHAAAGADLVIAHGSQYGGAVQLVAEAYPDVTFAWGTAGDGVDAPNVHAYTARADEGGFVNGLVAANLTASGAITVIGPIAVGDAARYADGFVAGAASVDPAVQTRTVYIDSYTDLGLAAEAAATQTEFGVDVLTASSQIANGVRPVALDANVPWFATQSSQNAVDDLVVASQVYHWEVALRDLAAALSSGDPVPAPGTALPPLTLANGGLVIEFNPDHPLDDAVRAQADEAIAALADGSLSTGVS